MNIKILTENLNEYIFRQHTPIPEFSPDEGIRFLTPVPNHPTPGAMYIGTVRQWNHLYQNNLLLNESTYLIYSNNALDFTDFVPPQMCNVFFLNTNVITLLQRINSLLDNSRIAAHSEFIEKYHSFWNYITSDGPADCQTTKKYFETFPYEIKKYLACIVVRTELPGGSPLTNEQIDKKLKSFFPETNLFYFQNEWIILYSQDNCATDALDFAYDKFSLLLDELHLSAGISYASQCPEQLLTLYMTAVTSIDLGIKLKIEPKQKRIYTYFQYNPYYIIHLSSIKFSETYKNTSLIYLMHPDIVKLYSYDKENRTNLIDVLYTYLVHGHSITITSELLYMHRNTVCNKLKKIDEIISHKLDNLELHFIFLLSCMLIKYQTEYI